MNNDIWRSPMRVPFVVNGMNLRVPYEQIVFDLTSKRLIIGDGCTCGGVGYIEVTPTCSPSETAMEKAKANTRTIETASDEELKSGSVQLKSNPVTGV